MSLNDILTVSISKSGAAPTRPSFGTALFAASDCPNTFLTRVQTVSGPDGVTALGFSASGQTAKAAAAYFGQTNRPKFFKIGRRANKPMQTLHLTPNSSVEGTTYKGTVGTTDFVYTVPNAATLATVGTAIAALIDADANAVATSTAGVITVTTGTAGKLVNVKGLYGPIDLQDVTADPGLAADLAAINAEDSDWYGLEIDSQSKAQALAAAAFAQANKKIYVFGFADTPALDPNVTDDTGSALKALSYDRTVPIWAPELLSYAGMAGMGDRFTADPGSYTWKFKTFAGVATAKLNTSQENALRGKNINYISLVAGLPTLQEGVTSQGEYPDVIRFLDWTVSEIKIQVFFVLKSQAKVPFTDGGVGQIKNAVSGVLKRGERVLGWAPDSTSVSAPKVAEVDAVSRAARLLPGVTFKGTLAGAIHSSELAGTVSV